MKEKKRRHIRHKRIRSRIKGTSKVPRLCVFRSNRHIYAQIIDDARGKIIASVNDKEFGKSKEKKIIIAKEVGKLAAKKSLEKKIEKVVFDRSGYKYHGKVKALAEGAREGGLKF